MRILDAALNRAGEGLRVIEDFARFVLDDAFLTRQAKQLRHDLATAGGLVSASDLLASRETQFDVGTNVTTPAEGVRIDAWDACAASLKRTEQSLRTLEEYGKLLDTSFPPQLESLRYRLYTLEKALGLGLMSRQRLGQVRLCVLVDGRDSADEFERLIRRLVEAGVDMIQLRDKRLSDRELVTRARLLVSLTRSQPQAEPGAVKCTPSSTLAIINDRADIAAAVHADGVHLGQDDLTVKDARTIVDPRMLVGVSTHNLEQARAAVLDGANYLGGGPTFPSRTKTFEKFAGLDYLRQVAAETHLPIFAIGGITAENVRDVMATGVARLAIGAAVTEAAEPGSAARELLDILETDGDARGTVAEATAPSGADS